MRDDSRTIKDKYGELLTPRSFTWEKGCASHSDFQSEREKVLDELIEHYEKVIEGGKGCTYNHPITYRWMYGDTVVGYLKRLRQAGEP